MNQAYKTDFRFNPLAAERLEKSGSAAFFIAKIRSESGVFLAIGSRGTLASRLSGS